MKTKQKNKRILLIICFVVVMLLVVLGGYLIYEKVLSSENAKDTELKDSNTDKDNDKGQEEPQEKEMDKETEVILLKMIEEDSAIVQLKYFKKSYLNLNEIPNSEKIKMAMRAYTNPDVKNNVEADLENWTGEILTTYIQSLFAKSFKTQITFPKENIICEIDNKLMYSYDKITDKFSYYSEWPNRSKCVTTHPNGAEPRVSMEINSAIETKIVGNNYIITVVKVLGVCEDDICIFPFIDAVRDRLLFYEEEPWNEQQLITLSDDEYPNYTDGEDENGYRTRIINAYENKFYNMRDEYIEKMAKYRYTFVKENDKYLLESYEFIG